MKFVIVLFCLFSVQAIQAQVIIEDSFRMTSSKEANNFDGKIQRAVLPDEWPGENAALKVSEVTFEKGAMTHWHRHDGDQYLFATKGQGMIQFYDTGGKLITQKISSTGRVYIPSKICHRHGSDGKTKVFSHIYITNGTTQWDGCNEEYAPQEEAPAAKK